MTYVIIGLCDKQILREEVSGDKMKFYRRKHFIVRTFQEGKEESSEVVSCLTEGE